MPLTTYVETLRISAALASARIGNQEKIDGFRRLDNLRRATFHNPLLAVPFSKKREAAASRAIPRKFLHFPGR
jgi:hypothetical protein